MSEQELKNLLDQFGYRLWYVQSLTQIIRRLEASTVRTQFPLFFGSVHQACWNEIITNLCALCDTDNRGWTVHTLLVSIDQNKDLFSQENWERRLGLITAALQYEPISSPEIKADMGRVKKHPTVSKLLQLRNNIVAHVSKDWLLGEFKPPQVSLTEIAELVDLMFDVVNRYFRRFNATTYGKLNLADVDSEFVRMQNVLKRDTLCV
jgi:hypothetical protein